MKRPAAPADDGPQKKTAACHSKRLEWCDQFDTLPGIADRMLRKLSQDKLTSLKDTLMRAKVIKLGGAYTESNLFTPGPTWGRGSPLT